MAASVNYFHFYFVSLTFFSSYEIIVGLCIGVLKCHRKVRIWKLRKALRQHKTLIVHSAHSHTHARAGHWGGGGSARNTSDRIIFELKIAAEAIFHNRYEYNHFHVQFVVQQWPRGRGTTPPTSPPTHTENAQNVAERKSSFILIENLLKRFIFDKLELYESETELILRFLTKEMVAINSGAVVNPLE